ncbi:TIGR03087 family PEP-CTERM/XrtA system glycosyltransferase [Congregibacter variabilis]|uniref:TIGR03087 family PEP-CTERM/XrtA system glycosyltransferase n=1 Tax=Congregibacter variabilis TaxID=3081200 RepID=A0ABZ0I929_9GAMM|nr:TIGR03087 family PEP-CTERM/XrtA system glycosyltransferase [Congregibacter sp. IMCC43200]
MRRRKVIHTSSSKPPLLLLTHRIPYPPDKGDKIRSFHLLKALSRYFEIYLATFVDDPDDWVHCAAVKHFCRDTLFRPLHPMRGRVASLKALLTGDALSREYYRDALMTRWINRVVAEHAIDRAIAVSSPMAQYLLPSSLPRTIKQIYADFVDLDSEKWRAYAESKSWPQSIVYRREARRLLAWEERVAGFSQRTFFVSRAEKELFERTATDQPRNIDFFANGVDADYFNPNADYEDPFDNHHVNLVFTGAMDYWPNVDAVSWFVESVMPTMGGMDLEVHFWIVGGKPSAEVKALGQHDRVHVTGRVPDVRPYLKYATAAVAPMRIARGLQNKVLEAMAMAKPVLVSEAGLEGIPAVHGEHALVVRELQNWRPLVADLVHLANEEIGGRARDLVLREFSWRSNLSPVLEQLSSPFQGGYWQPRP